MPDAISAAARKVPEVLHERPAATLLVDLDAGTVVFANALAIQLAPGVRLPVPVDEWSQAARLHSSMGVPLRGGPTSLLDVARGNPPRGIQVTAARGSGSSVPREALWAVGIPLDDAPPPLAHQALVVLLPVRERTEVRALQELGDDLHARAAMASDLSFTITDPNLPDNPIVWVNPAFERVTGYSSDDALGRNCRFLQGEGTDRAVVARMRHALERHLTVADTLLNYRKDGTPFWNQVVISPVLDADGHVTHHVGIQADVTDRIRSQSARDAQLDQAQQSSDRLRLLARVSDELARHLDYTGAVGALAEVAVPALADWGFVVVVNERGRLDRLHVATREPLLAAAAASLETLEMSWLVNSPRVQEALRSGSDDPVHPLPVDLDSLPGRTTPEQLELLERLGLGSALVVPLRARDSVIGVLVLVDRPGSGFSEHEVVTAAHIGYRAGLGLDNVRLYQRERDAALTLQHSLLPEIPQLPGLDIAATYLPAVDRSEVGGDWFDVLPLPDGAIGLALGDVVGHDMRAAASMGQLRSVLRSYAWSGEPAGRVVAHLDELVRGLGMADLATCVYLRLADGVLEYSRAGHPAPLLRLPTGDVQPLDQGLGTPVGVKSLTDDVPQARVAMPVGSVLVAYSDGLVERRDRGLRDGMSHLSAALGAVPAEATAAQVRDALVTELLGPRLDDDVCVLVVRRT